MVSDTTTSKATFSLMVTYESAAAVAEDLKKRGFSPERKSTAESRLTEKTQKNTWQRAAKTASTQSNHERIKVSLQSWQRP